MNIHDFFLNDCCMGERVKLTVHPGKNETFYETDEEESPGGSIPV